MNVSVHFQDPKNVEAWKAMFTESDTVTAHHRLYEEVKEQRPDVAKLMPKFVFYVCNFTVFGMPTEQDDKGNLGYRLHFNPTPPQP